MYKFIKNGVLFVVPSDDTTALLNKVFDAMVSLRCDTAEFEVSLDECVFFPKGNYKIRMTPGGLGIAEIGIDLNTWIVIEKLSDADKKNLRLGTLLKNKEGVCVYPPSFMQIEDIEDIKNLKIVTEKAFALKSFSKRYMYYTDETNTGMNRASPIFFVYRDNNFYLLLDEDKPDERYCISSL